MMKTPKMPIKSMVMAVAILCASSSVFAMNVYRPGTDGYEISKALEPYLPMGMTAILMEHEDPTAFLSELDLQALPGAGITEQTFNHLKKRMQDAALDTHDLLAYSISGAGIPGNTPVVRICAIVKMDVETNDWAGALTHEALHCRNSEVRGTKAYVDYLTPIWKAQASNISWLNFTGFVDESMVAGLQVAFAAKNGDKNPPNFVEVFTHTNNRPGNSTGTRTAKNVIDRCFVKASCPTDSNQMLHMLMDDNQLRDDLIQDMLDISG